MSPRVVPLSPETWDTFAELVERNNGVYGGCWCIAYHVIGKVRLPDYREAKRQFVMEDRAHAALVLDGNGLAQGWAQYGPPEELEGFKHRREYLKDPPPRPDWRITCVFVDKAHRGQGYARAAIEGAIGLIAAAGGGRTEAISEATDGREAQGRFLFSATAEVFDDLGFDRVRRVGKHAWLLSREVFPAPVAAG